MITSVDYIDCLMSGSPLDTIPPIGQDSSTIGLDNTVFDSTVFDSTGIHSTGIDSLGVDTLVINADHPSNNISRDAFLDPVFSEARDSTIMDHIDEKLYLYGEAEVKYQTMTLSAGLIIIDYKINEATAYPGVDSVGNEINLPHFIDGENDFTCKKLRFNFDTKKGMIYEARTKEEDLYVIGTRTKFISKDADSTMTDDIVYSENATVTSCDADHPHFGILAKKMKIIPGKVAVVGTSWLKIMDIPLIPLPFGFFPMNKGRSTGLIFPSDFDFIPTLTGGVGLRGIGWYFPINDNLDVQVLGDISSRGSWGVRSVANYNVKYKYRGDVRLSYSKLYTDNDDTGVKTGLPAFAINFSHYQDAKAHPYRTISGSVDISTSGFYQRDQYDAKTQLTNTYTSNFGMTYKVPNSPISYTLDLRHEQNTNTKKVTVDLPVLTMRMNSIFPFKSKDVGANKEKWYEKINVAYNAALSNKIIATDSTLFKKEVFDDMQNGMKQHADAGASFKVAKYFNLNFNVNYDEYWTLKTLNRNLTDDYAVTIDTLYDEFDGITPVGLSRDTTSYGVVVDDYDNGFATQRNMTASVGLGTKVFGTIQSSKGFFRGLRHTWTPSVSMNYNPDTKNLYEELYFNDLRENERDSLYFNPFEQAVYKSGLRSKGLSAGYSITNIFEAKFRGRKDTLDKKVKLFNSIGLSGNYNFAADSLKWSVVSISANTPLLWGWSNLRVSGSLDPYQEVDGQRINTFVWDKKFKLPEVERMQFTLATSFSLSDVFDLFSKEEKETKRKKSRSKSNKKEKEVFSAAPSKLSSLIEKFKITHDIAYLIQRYDDRDTSYMSRHSITLQADIPISENWSVNLTRISYDFIQKKINYPQLGFTRKLHCWEMGFNWSPYYDSFSFKIGVVSSTLEFLKTNYGKNQSTGSLYNGGL